MIDIDAIVQSVQALPLEEQGPAIAKATIKAVRAADAAISPEAIEADFRVWWKSQGWPTAPGLHAVSTHKAYAQHLLGRGIRV